MTDRPLDPANAGTYRLGDRTVKRMGYGAMQLAGAGVMGPPDDPDEALAVLREAVSLGVDHIDTSDFYGPHVVNREIREALHPYPGDLAIVTKLGARRDEAGHWLPALSPEELRRAVESNCENLGVDHLFAANLRLMFGDGTAGPTEGVIEPLLEPLVAMQEEGLIRHLGISNALPVQVARARLMTDIVCVQNHYNLAHRDDDALIDELAEAGIAYVPFFPLGGFSPLQSETLDAVAQELDASPFQIALAWLLQRSDNILVIPGTSSRAHLRDNIAAASLELPDDALERLNGIAG